jgi:hypothetical protein
MVVVWSTNPSLVSVARGVSYPDKAELTALEQ